MKFYCLDERVIWREPMLKVACERGYDARSIRRGGECEGPGYGFIRCHADPVVLSQNQHDWDVMASRLTMIQDEAQVRCYDSKSEQISRWSDWMPPTRRFEDYDDALTFADCAQFPIVSKADVGASSVNVRIIQSKQQLIEHINQVFGPGIQVNHCSGGPGGRVFKSLQRGYVILQQFIPHTVTWRVNAIGNARAIFKRYCYPDKPVAQTGNVEPVTGLDAETESLLDFADRWFAHAGTKWCAIDVLKDGDTWRFLECSLSWPWPSPGACSEAMLFRSKNRRWKEIWECMFDEIEAGTWGG